MDRPAVLPNPKQLTEGRRLSMAESIRIYGKSG
jgi:hypothetical protein